MRNVLVLFIAIILLTPTILAEWTADVATDGTIRNYNELTASDVQNMGDSVGDYISDFDQWPSEAQKGLTADQIGKNLAALKGKESQLSPAAYGAAVGGKTGTVASVDTSKGPVDGVEAQSADGAGMSFSRLPSASFSAGAFSGVGGRVAVTAASGASVTAKSVCVESATVLDAGASFADVSDACVRDVTTFSGTSGIRIVCAAGGSWSTDQVRDGVFSLTATTGLIRLSSDTPQEFTVTDCDESRHIVMMDGQGAFVEWTNDGIRSGNARVDELLVLPPATPKNETASTPVTAETAVIKEVIITPQGPVVLYDLSAGKLGKSAFSLDSSMTYSVSFSDKKADFEVVAKAKHAVFVRRGKYDVLPAASESCTECTVIDYPARKVKVVGTAAYKRQFAGKDGRVLPGFVTIFQASDAGTAAEFSMSEDLVTIKKLILRTPPDSKGPITTRMDNRITIKEVLVKEGLFVKPNVHRLIAMDDSLAAGEVSASLVREYGTEWSGASMVLEEGVLRYKRGALSFTVLPPGHALIDGLLQQRVASLALLGLLVVPLARKRGSVMLFALAGIVFLIIIAFLVFVVQSGSAPQESSEYGAYVRECLRLQGREALGAVNAAGGRASLPGNVWFVDGKASVLSVSDIESAVKEVTERRIVSCLAGLGDVKGVTVTKAKASVSVIVAEEDVVLSLDWPVSVLKGGTRHSLGAVSVVVPLHETLLVEATAIMAESEEEYEGMIDVDALPERPLDITLFPKNGRRYSWTLDATMKESPFVAEHVMV